MANLFDVGAKYGRVGAGVGNLTKAGIGLYQADANKDKVDSLIRAYESNQAPFGVTAGEGAKQSFKASRLATMLRDLDPEMSKRYEVLSGNLAKKEMSGEASKALLDARNKPEVDYTTQKGIYDSAKQKSSEDTTKFLADEVAWKSVATDIEGLTKELADANADLGKLQKFHQMYKDYGDTDQLDPEDTAPILPMAGRASKYQLPDFANYTQNKIGQR